MKDLFTDLLRQDAASGRRGFPCEQYADGNSAALQDLAHDLRQPLGTIETLAYYLEMTASDDNMCVHLQRIRAMVGQANRILERVADITEHLALETSSC